MLLFYFAATLLLSLFFISDAFTSNVVHRQTRKIKETKHVNHSGILALRAKKSKSTSSSDSGNDASKNVNKIEVKNEFESTIQFSPPDEEDETVEVNPLDNRSEEMRVKLKEEISSPFRKLRQFLYSGMGAAGFIGTLTAVPQLIFAVQDKVQESIVSTGGNVAIDVGAIVLAVVLWDRDSKAENIKLERYTKKEKLMSSQMSVSEKGEREKELSLLPIQIQINEKNENATRIVSFGELQKKGKQNIIIVAGKREFVTDAIISAKIEGADIFNSKETYVVPVVLEDDQIEAALAKGFGAPKESLMTAPYIGKPMQINVWEAYLKKETDLAILQGEVDIVKKGIVIAVKRNGRVIRRGVGIPPWKATIDEFQDIIK